MDERLRFVARLLDGEKMAALCREFDISRKTGYKIFNRYKNSGLEGLTAAEAAVSGSERPGLDAKTPRNRGIFRALPEDSRKVSAPAD